MTETVPCGIDPPKKTCAASSGGLQTPGARRPKRQASAFLLASLRRAELLWARAAFGLLVLPPPHASQPGKKGGELFVGWTIFRKGALSRQSGLRFMFLRLNRYVSPWRAFLVWIQRSFLALLPMVDVWGIYRMASSPIVHFDWKRYSLAHEHGSVSNLGPKDE